MSTREETDLNSPTQLYLLMFTGGLSGLLSVFGHSVAWSAADNLGLRNPNSPREVHPTVIEMLMHLIAGIALGALFWLSWGLAAVVDVSWLVRGLTFAGLTFAAVCFPVLASVLLAAREAKLSAIAVIARWATTCVAVSLSCSWNWAHAL
ncbi:MAG TPA: hypothetical protein VFS47_03520 [Steroidobacteraceae bacterium]|nr:hypothetical protein [Steroidobacteraceae bacterium]